MADPISLSCPACEKSMKVPAELQGQKIKCKACGHLFVVKPPRKAEDEEIVPVLEEEEAKPKAKKPAKKAAVKPAAKQPAKPAAKDNDEDDGKAYDVTTTDLGARCPECANDMEGPDAILCLFCGYNTQTRTRAMLKKTIAYTFWDWAFWLAPGIGCILSIFLLIGIDVWYCMRINAYVDDQWYFFVGYGGIKLWLVIISLFFMYLAVRFAIKRLILHPVPPEKIKLK